VGEGETSGGILVVPHSFSMLLVVIVASLARCRSGQLAINRCTAEIASSKVVMIRIGKTEVNDQIVEISEEIDTISLDLINLHQPQLFMQRPQIMMK